MKLKLEVQEKTHYGGGNGGGTKVVMLTDNHSQPDSELPKAQVVIIFPNENEIEMGEYSVEIKKIEK